MAGGGSKNILLKAVLLGDGGVGKSCLMNRFVSNRFDPTSFHTIGVEFLNKEVSLEGQLYTIQIWDTAGQERFKSLRTPFYRGSDICLLTFALDDRPSFQNLANWRDEFLYYADVKDKASFPFVVIGNKVDLDPDRRTVSKETVVDWCASNGNLPYVETSAKDATNVLLAFQSALERWAKLDASSSPGGGARPYHGPTVSLSSSRAPGPAGQTSASSCCFQ